MGQTCILTGMVLSSLPSGEYDKRIVLLTKERGKVTAFARGARRPKSSMQAGTNLFCFGTFEAYEGRDAYTVVKVEISNYFRELTADLDLTYYGCYFLELADYFTQPNGSDSVNQLKLLYQTLRALCAPSIDNRLVRVIYELKTLAFYGVAPNVFGCVRCNEKDHLSRFSFESRGLLCDRCAAGYPAYHLDAAAVYTMQYILTSPVQKLYTFRVTGEVLGQLRFVMERYLAIYVDRPLKTAIFLPDADQ